MPSFDLDDRLFWLAKESEIKTGKTTDVYFQQTRKVLEENGIDSRVVMEVYARDLPYEQTWGVLSGVYEAAKLLEGLPIDVWSFDEGAIFLADGRTAMYEPLMTIEGRYRDFLEYETPLLGLLASSTSITTKGARLRLAAGDRLLFSFGTRRVHPVLSAMVERACHIAGFDGVSNVLGAKLLGVKASGTMPHALMQVVGDNEKAWKLFDKTMPRSVPRVVLADTFYDEKTEAIQAYELLGDRLWGVRLDTPASRRGNFRKIIEEVRWELNIRGGKKVRIIASGKLDEVAVSELRDIADGFGVGSAVSYPPVIDLSAKIVEVIKGSKRSFRAKRGGLGGKKAVYRSAGFKDTVALWGTSRPARADAMLRPLIRNGKIVREYEGIEKIRSRVSRGLEQVKSAEPSIAWS
ncbi:MAG TPA: nicotinate phosphoribosyltransferase [Nitrososphaerales archaeon]|nr:nicotinate phosphoribosyltransferase [Nitrososphaerales archaeon]